MKMAGFTVYFAKKTIPDSLWETDLFKRINRHITLFWAGIFMLSIVSGLIPGLFGISGVFKSLVFEAIIPVMMMLIVGLPLNKRYPEYYQKKMGVQPEKEEPIDDQSSTHDIVTPEFSYEDSAVKIKKEKEKVPPKDLFALKQKIMLKK